MLAGEIGHHGVEDQHSRRRAAQAGIAEALDEAVFDEELFAVRIRLAAG